MSAFSAVENWGKLHIARKALVLGCFVAIVAISIDTFLAIEGFKGAIEYCGGGSQG